MQEKFPILKGYMRYWQVLNKETLNIRLKLIDYQCFRNSSFPMANTLRISKKESIIEK